MNTDESLFESLGAEAVRPESALEAMHAVYGVPRFFLVWGGLLVSLLLAFLSPAAFLYFWPISFLLNVLSTANLL